MVKMSPARIAEIQKKKEAQQKGKPGRVGTKREPTQAEVDARRNKMRLEKAKAEKRGPFRTVPGRQGLKKGGGVCKKGMGRAYGRNS
jgi:hypothetical protein